MYVSLLDRRGFPLWFNHDVPDHDAFKNHSFLDDVHPDDLARIEAAFARTIIRQEEVEYNVRCIVDGRETVFHARLYPIEGEPAVICLSTVLEDKRLTEAEIEVVNLLAQDHTIKEIASITHRSESAIDARVKSLKTKLGMTTLHGVVAEAMRLRLTETG